MANADKAPALFGGEGLSACAPLSSRALRGGRRQPPPSSDRVNNGRREEAAEHHPRVVNRRPSLTSRRRRTTTLGRQTTERTMRLFPGTSVAVAAAVALVALVVRADDEVNILPFVFAAENE